MDVLPRVIQLLRDTLELDPAAPISAETLLFESLPELDSLGVVTVVQAFEEQFGIAIEPEDIGAKTFESVESLARFVEAKLAG